MTEPGNSPPFVWTIGHSTHAPEAFLALLGGAGVTAVADVRSSPFSRIVPHFNREALGEMLAAHGIAYRFLGKFLGARPEGDDCWDGDRVSYAKLAATGPFGEGLRRVIEGARLHRLALMCAERDPLDCHRTILVARHLARSGVVIAHIHADGRIESHDEAEQRLLQDCAMTSHDLFLAPDEQIAAAYACREREIAFRRDGDEVPARTREAAHVIGVR